MIGRLGSLIICGVAVSLLSGCLLSRPSAPATRYLDVTFGDPQPAADVTREVRLANIGAAELVQHSLVFARDGELQPRSSWQWATRPDRSLSRALTVSAASSGIALRDSATVSRVSMTLTDFHLTEIEPSSAESTQSESANPPRYTLTGHTYIGIATPDGAIVYTTATVSAEATGPLPGDLPQIAGGLLTDLATASWQAVIDATTPAQF